MAFDTISEILENPNFQAADPEVQRSIRKRFFEKKVSSNKNFLSATPEVQATIKTRVLGEQPGFVERAGEKVKELGPSRGLFACPEICDEINREQEALPPINK